MSLQTPRCTAATHVTIIQRGGETGSDPGAFASAVRQGLLANPKTLPWPYFYDEEGSRLFELICQLPEYYLTRTEDALLKAHADAMVAGWERPPALVELGSGSAIKTQRLIEAALRRYGSVHYLPIDVSSTFIEESAESLLRVYPDLRITGHVADYRTELGRVAERLTGPKLVIFLGSSLGNYEPREASALLRQVAWVMGPSDRLLLGTDLDKDRAVLEAAYDDAQGVTARFNLNLLARVNRELGADFDLDAFAHQARYCADLERVEMHLVSLMDQTVTIPASRLTATFSDGESIHTENSYKYTSARLKDLAARAGLEEEHAWTDDQGLFRLQRWKLKGTH